MSPDASGAGGHGRLPDAFTAPGSSSFSDFVGRVAPEPVAAAPQVQTSEIDDILDEIDGVLESNAEEFVRGFVQKGGQ